MKLIDNHQNMTILLSLGRGYFSAVGNWVQDVIASLVSASMRHSTVVV